MHIKPAFLTFPFDLFVYLGNAMENGLYSGKFSYFLFNDFLANLQCMQNNQGKVHTYLKYVLEGSQFQKQVF